MVFVLARCLHDSDIAVFVFHKVLIRLGLRLDVQRSQTNGAFWHFALTKLDIDFIFKFVVKHRR